MGIVDLKGELDKNVLVAEIRLLETENTRISRVSFDEDTFLAFQL